jgi:membrane-bound lytic murein transglycosylase D
MSYSLFTRDKFFVTDDELLRSINMTADQLPKYTDEEIMQKMRLIPTLVPLTYNKKVREFIDFFAYRRRGLMSRCLANSQIYFPIFEEVLDRKGLPIELKYLPIVESAFNPVAVSSAGATGLWQLMHGTGKMMGLDIDSYADERRDPKLATEAATDYLKKLYDMYGDWHLVLAAYNSGPGNVNKAIARSGGSRNFWTIMTYLPAETRSYVPTYIAAVYVMHNYKDYELVSAEPKRELYSVDTVMITAKVSLKHISSVIGIPEDELQFLNPSLKTGVVPYLANGFALNLPISYFALFEARKEDVMNDSTVINKQFNMAVAPDPKTIYYTVKSNDNLSSIANKYKVTTSEIKKWNHLKNSTVATGQKLKIIVYPKVDSPPSYQQAFANKVIEKPKVDSTNAMAVVDSASNNNPDSSTQAKKQDEQAIKLDAACGCIVHVVQPGDTLWSIAKRYEGVTVDKLKASNKSVADRPIKVGDIIKIFL